MVAARLDCHLCKHWVETRVIGATAATEQLDKHMREAHGAATFPPESKLFVLPPCDGKLERLIEKAEAAARALVGFPRAGSVQSDAAALDARAPLSVPCRKCGLMLVDHGGRDHGYEPPTLAAEVAALAAGAARPPLATNHEAVLDFKFRGTATEFRAWCRAYVDGGSK